MKDNLLRIRVFEATHALRFMKLWVLRPDGIPLGLEMYGKWFCILVDEVVQ